MKNKKRIILFAGISIVLIAISILIIVLHNTEDKEKIKVVDSKEAEK